MEVFQWKCPQGSVLGPLLFSLYTRHLPGSLSVLCVMFADDILLYYSGPSPLTSAQALSSAMSTLAALVEDLGLQLNVAKTQAMFVLPRAHSLPPTLQTYCGDRALDIVSSYKYLGLYIDDGLTWKERV